MWTLEAQLALAWAAWLPRLPCLPLCTSMRSRRYRDRISNHGVTLHARKQARRYPNTSHRCLATVVGKVIAWHSMLVVRGMRQASLNSIRRGGGVAAVILRPGGLSRLPATRVPR